MDDTLQRKCIRASSLCISNKAILRPPLRYKGRFSFVSDCQVAKQTTRCRSLLRLKLRVNLGKDTAKQTGEETMENNNNASSDTPDAGLCNLDAHDTQQNVQVSKRRNSTDVTFWSSRVHSGIFGAVFCILTCAAFYAALATGKILPIGLIYCLGLLLCHMAYEQAVWKFEVIKHLRQIRDSLENIEQHQNKPEGDVK